MQISKHISFAEATKSATADKLGIVNNNPSLDAIENMKLLAEKVFEPIREHFKKPIFISSMYRGIPLNVAIGGSKTSQHTGGEAMDIDMGDKGKPSNFEIFQYIKNNLEFDQLIWEFGSDKNPSWVHVSYSKHRNRKQVLKARKNELNKIYYENFR
jgi:hypothetical protein